MTEGARPLCVSKGDDSRLLGMTKLLEYKSDEDRETFGKLYPSVHDAFACDARCQHSTDYGRWRCTRGYGHLGPHVAHDRTDRALATWYP